MDGVDSFFMSRLRGWTAKCCIARRRIETKTLEDALTRQVESMLVPQLAERLNLSSQEEFSKKPQQERMSNTFLLF